MTFFILSTLLNSVPRHALISVPKNALDLVHLATFSMSRLVQQPHGSPVIRNAIWSYVANSGERIWGLIHLRPIYDH